MPKKGSKYPSHRNSSKNHNNTNGKEVPLAASSSSPSSIVISPSSNSQSERADTGKENAKHKSLHISSKNNRRWDSLKSITGYTNDDDLLSYLLELAESITGRDSKCNNSFDWKKDCEKENEDSIEEQNDHLHDDAASNRHSTVAELSEGEEKRHHHHRDGRDREKLKHSRSKKHKSKSKHHKEKRKKKRHHSREKIDDIEAQDEDVVDSVGNVDEVAKEKIVTPAETNEQETRPAESKVTKNSLTESLKKVRKKNDARIVSQETNFVDTKAEIKVCQTKETDVNNGQNENLSKPADQNQSNFYSIDNFLTNNETDDQKFGKKKRKRSRHENEPENSSNPEPLNTPSVSESLLKYRKKKYKFVEHKMKKSHDVRKAPQDGIVVTSENRDSEAVNGSINDSSDQMLPEVANLEPQKLAIKIKLCQDCNTRHLQDACPLGVSNHVIRDSISLKNWISKHANDAEIMKAVNSNNPISEGYPKNSDDGDDSDEESNSSDQFKSKSKDSEEKQLYLDENKPLYARDSLPECLEFRHTNTDHGIGVFVKQDVPMQTRLGPVVGTPVKEMDIPDDFSMRHIWEVEINGKTIYLSTTNPVVSNWIRYVRPSETREDRNVSVICSNGELVLVANKHIAAGSEMLYWADSHSSTWTKKNKTDKTNCGGCNLTFAHPIYYRLHCCIFHDTNYSLTIRKYHCKVCGAAVLGKDNIMKHAAELHGGRGAYQCQFCKKFFLRLNYLEMHRTYGCSQNPQRSRPLCDFCGRKFCQPQKLKVHIKRMHRDMSEVLREFQCKLCLKLLGSRAALQRHMKEVHHKDVVGAATCDRCGKMFQNKSNLKIHMLTHSGIKPFKCREDTCKAAFTTKQCLQFHYKKVHGLSEDLMPKIERSVAYTFDAYSGGMIEDMEKEDDIKISRRSSQDNSNSLSSTNENSLDNNMEKINESVDSVDGCEKYEIPENHLEQQRNFPDHQLCPPSPPSPAPPLVPMAPIDSPVDHVHEVDLYTVGARPPQKASKKWLDEFNHSNAVDLAPSQMSANPGDIYDFQDRRDAEEKILITSHAQPNGLLEEPKLGLSMYRRTESSNASLLVEAALDAAERDIGTVSSPILDDHDRDNHLYSISNHLESPIPQRSPDPHLDSYIQHQEDLDDVRHSPPGSHMHLDYHIHRPPIDYVSAPPRNHSIEQYLDHPDIPRVSSPSAYIHVPQEEMTPPSPTSGSRYSDIHLPHHHLHHQSHHQVPTDNNLSSDEGENSVAQNLSLSSVKEKSLQLDLSSTTYKYDALVDPDFRDRPPTNFEPLVINGGELHGLDMTARGFHQSFGHVQNSRFHHHPLYDVGERQTVDLSRTGTTYSAMSPPPPPPPPYSHNDVLRVLSLDLTPAGRHSVDLSLTRSHHPLHSAASRLIPSPPLANSNHIVPETMDGRVFSPPPPQIPNFNSTYPVGPSSYHTSRSGYHPYTGYY